VSAGNGRRPRKLTVWNHVRAVLLLPFMNTVVIPASLILVFRDARIWTATPPSLIASLAIALPMLLFGTTLVIRAISLFVTRGRGTLAPWDPTEALITEGVYRFSRNPLKSGLFLILVGESVLLQSAALAIWAVAFIAVNVLYIRWSEEPGLTIRFGEEYAAYCRRVPRWLQWTPAKIPGATEGHAN
jgi:protein-S-isoprenylcysteine O-methyltransferase Ste14